MATTRRARDYTRRIGLVPPLPEVASLVLKMLDDPKSSAPEITNVITREPALSGQILKTINSAYFGLKQKVTNLNQAVTLMGFRKIRQLVLNVSVFRVLSKLSRRREAMVKFWRHSAIAAALCRHLAAKIRTPLPEDQAYVTGLLHDMGKPLFMKFDGTLYDKVLALAELEQIPFHQAERRLGETTHCALGAWAARKWNLPDAVINAIREHHSPAALTSDALTACVHVANYVCWIRGFNCEGTYWTEAFNLEVWNFLGLAQDQLEQLTHIADMEGEIAEIILGMAV